MQQYGDFGAKLMFLVVSSHDAYDTMDFQPVVNVYPSYPSKQYPFAIAELIDRYLLPRILKKKKVESDHITKGHVFNPGFMLFYEYTQSNNIPFFIYLHPDRKEMEEHAYDAQGKEIIRFCEEHAISLIQGLDYESLDCFRDGIHLNEHGQRVLANALLSQICTRIENSE